MTKVSSESHVHWCQGRAMHRPAAYSGAIHRFVRCFQIVRHDFIASVYIVYSVHVHAECVHRVRFLPDFSGRGSESSESALVWNPTNQRTCILGIHGLRGLAPLACSLEGATRLEPIKSLNWDLQCSHCSRSLESNCQTATDLLFLSFVCSLANCCFLSA